MSSRLRSACIAGLLVGCAAVVGVGCSSDSAKKVVHTPVGGAGEGGEAGEAAGGASGGHGGSGGATPAGGEAGAQSEAGQGGAAVGAAGAEAAGAPAGGAPDISVAGAAGEPGAAGEAGAGPVACVPSGTTYGVNIDPENQQTVCRGAFVTVNINASDSDTNFTCCGVSNSVPSYAIEVDGTSSTPSLFSFQVPGDAPLGEQSITATCSSGVATNTVDLNVVNTPLPALHSLEQTLIYSGDTVIINGSNFDPASDRLTAVSVTDPSNTSECFIDTTASASDSISCGFDGISAGTYTIVLQQSDCGYVTNNTLTLTIQQSL
jgi:hypothetical protein